MFFIRPSNTLNTFSDTLGSVITVTFVRPLSAISKSMIFMVSGSAAIGFQNGKRENTLLHSAHFASPNRASRQRRESHLTSLNRSSSSRGREQNGAGGGKAIARTPRRQ